MSFLLDTNVVSEWAKAQPNPGVVRWLAEADEDGLFLSVVTLAELRHGVERLAAGARRKRLQAWIDEELSERFEKRILPVDVKVSDCWGRLIARGFERQGDRVQLLIESVACLDESHLSGRSHVEAPTLHLGWDLTQSQRLDHASDQRSLRHFC